MIKNRKLMIPVHQITGFPIPEIVDRPSAKYVTAYHTGLSISGHVYQAE